MDLDNPDITDKILDAIEATDLDPNQTKKLEREFKKEIHIMTAPQRLKSVAKSIDGHAAISDEVKNDLKSNKLDELIDKIDLLLKED